MVMNTPRERVIGKIFNIGTGEEIRIKEDIGWEPRVEFKEGLKETIKWYKENEKWWKRMEWMLKIPYKTWNGRQFWL